MILEREGGGGIELPKEGLGEEVLKKIDRGGA